MSHFLFTCIVTFGLFIPGVSLGQGPVTKDASQKNEVVPSPKVMDDIPKEPLYFDVHDNELKVMSPILSWDMKSSQGAQLKIGDTEFNDQAIRPSISGDTFKVEWNRQLIEPSEISMIDRMGAEKWKSDISGEGLWSFDYRKSDNPIRFSEGERFRYCLKEKATNSENYTAICSRWHAYENRNGQAYMWPAVGTSSPRVIVEQEEVKLQGQADAAVNVPFQFFATLTSGDSYEFRSAPRELKIRDMILSKDDPTRVELIGEKPNPANIEVEDLRGDIYGSLLNTHLKQIGRSGHEIHCSLILISM